MIRVHPGLIPDQLRSCLVQHLGYVGLQSGQISGVIGAVEGSIQREYAVAKLGAEAYPEAVRLMVPLAERYQKSSFLFERLATAYAREGNLEGLRTEVDRFLVQSEDPSLIDRFVRPALAGD